MVATDEKIKHSTRKMQNAQTTRDQVGKDEDRQRTKLDALRRDLQTARRAADEATGSSSCFFDAGELTLMGTSYYQRHTVRHPKITRL